MTLVDIRIIVNYMSENTILKMVVTWMLVIREFKGMNGKWTPLTRETNKVSIRINS